MSCLTQQLGFSGVRNPAISFEVFVAVCIVTLCAPEHVLAAGCPWIPGLTSLAGELKVVQPSFISLT